MIKRLFSRSNFSQEQQDHVPILPSVDSQQQNLMSPFERYQYFLDQQMSTARIKPSSDIFTSWKSKGYAPLKWRCAKVAQSDMDSIYNIKMTQDQQTMLLSSQTMMHVFSCQNGVKKLSNFQPHAITWAISDIDISDDSKLAVSSSLNPMISLYDLQNLSVLDLFNLFNEDQQQWNDYYRRFYSCKLSGDKTCIIGGSGRLENNAYIQYFDMNKKKILHSISAHTEDINTIGFIQREQTQMIMSGSDDGLLKIWDVRALGISNKPVGIFYGHFAGITYVDTRNDGVYICSNSKDQSCKLWDMRTMTSQQNLKHQFFKFDYRYQKPQQDIINRISSLPQEIHTDQSVCTFRSHEILRTLIRCHFSPMLTTNSDYIISGSYCGKIYIYSIREPQKAPIVLSYKEIKLKNSVKLDRENYSETQSSKKKSAYNADEEDDDDSLIRDLVWSDSGIISGDFSGRINEFRPIL